jgi:nitrogenase-associated protein
MAVVIFYEKPGCRNNTRQKAMLRAAGHQVEEHNLLTQSWTPDRLGPFFGDLPVSRWFNSTAPRVKSGEVKPEELDEETALQLMVADPLLIRRPLMQVGEVRRVGFDTDDVNTWIGLNPVDLCDRDVETCPRSHEETPCPVPSMA